jgi:hypothetical protein
MICLIVLSGLRGCMTLVFDHPFLLFLLAVVVQWSAAYAGDFFRRRVSVPAQDKWADLDLVRAATLTLLVLIIGFSFQMAITRYDQRKTYEREEANAIGTEFLRADLLPAEDANKVRASLVKYVQQRVLFYTVDDQAALARIDSETANLENALWQTVSRAANANPTPPMALAVSGMNDVLNARGYTQASWWNRIPLAAWGMMGLIAIAANLASATGRGKRIRLCCWSCQSSSRLRSFSSPTSTARAAASFASFRKT